MTTGSSKPQAKADIWSKPKMAKLLEQSVGSPVKLTRDEVVEIVRKAAGRRTDLLSGKKCVQRGTVRLRAFCHQACREIK